MLQTFIDRVIADLKRQSEWHAIDSIKLTLARVAAQIEAEPGPEQPQLLNAEGLRTDGPTLAQWVGAGYNQDAYPPRGYASLEIGIPSRPHETEALGKSQASEIPEQEPLKTALDAASDPEPAGDQEDGA